MIKHKCNSIYAHLCTWSPSISRVFRHSLEVSAAKQCISSPYKDVQCYIEILPSPNIWALVEILIYLQIRIRTCNHLFERKNTRVLFDGSWARYGSILERCCFSRVYTYMLNCILVHTCLSMQKYTSYCPSKLCACKEMIKSSSRTHLHDR